MEKRHFSPGNTYKLTKNITLILSIISILYSFSMFYASKDYLLGIEWARTYDKVCQPLEPVETRIDCLLIVQESFESRLRLAWQSLLLGISLPVLFFTITKAYDYLFPKK